ncbi:MAG: fibronectin type III domain-containing protein, partial [Nocardioidaceae bacterium]
EPPATFTVPKKDTRAPRITGTRVLALPDGTATVTWTTNEKSDSRVVFGTSRKRLTSSRMDSARVTSHAVVLTDLLPNRTYYFRVVSKDPAGNRAVRPSKAKRPFRFVSSAPGVAVHTAQQFRTGRLGGSRVLNTGFGALTLAKARTRATYQSNVLDAQQFVTWDRASWQAQVPRGTRLRVWVRTGSRVTPDSSWSSWQLVPASGGRIGTKSSRFLQYRVGLTGSKGKAPILTAIGFTYNGKPPPTPQGPG